MFSLWKDRAGSVAIYTAVVGTMMIGMSALAVDYGRLTVLRTQLQNAADAAALAGAAQLDGQPGARARAIDVATNAAPQSSSLADTMTVSNVEILRAINPDLATGVTDINARFVRVTMTPENINLMLLPVLNLLGTTGTASSATIPATATAQSDPFLCPPPTVIACDNWLEDPPRLVELTSPGSAGRQMAFRQRDQAPVRRVYNYRLCPPNTPGCTAAQATTFAANVGETQCGSSSVLILPQGTDSPAEIAEGVNSRFDEGPSPLPAQNIIEYGRDSKLEGLTVASPLLSGGNYGDGDWDPDAYWSANHGGPLPSVLGNPSRYQVYLYELGEDFARMGKQTIYPVPSDLPAGFTIVSSPGTDIPATGVPGSAPSPDPRRRVIIASIDRCEFLQFAAPLVPGGGYIELFITERTQDSIVFGEVIRGISPQNSEDFHYNARIVQ